MGIPIMQIRRPSDRLIFIIVISYLIKRSQYWNNALNIAFCNITSFILDEKRFLMLRLFQFLRCRFTGGEHGLFTSHAIIKDRLLLTLPSQLRAFCHLQVETAIIQALVNCDNLLLLVRMEWRFESDNMIMLKWRFLVKIASDGNMIYHDCFRRDLALLLEWWAAFTSAAHVIFTFHSPRAIVS